MAEEWKGARGQPAEEEGGEKWDRSTRDPIGCDLIPMKISFWELCEMAASGLGGRSDRKRIDIYVGLEHTAC